MRRDREIGLQHRLLCQLPKSLWLHVEGIITGPVRGLVCLPMLQCLVRSRLHGSRRLCVDRVDRGSLLQWYPHLLQREHGR